MFTVLYISWISYSAICICNCLGVDKINDCITFCIIFYTFWYVFFLLL